MPWVVAPLDKKTPLLLRLAIYVVLVKIIHISPTGVNRKFVHIFYIILFDSINSLYMLSSKIALGFYINV